MNVVDFLIGFLSGILLLSIGFYFLYTKIFEQKEQYKTRFLDCFYKKRFLEEKEDLKEEFSNLSSRFLQETSANFLKNSHQSLNLVLNPFEKEIKEFSDEIKNFYIHDAKERFALKKELERLQELNTKLLNESNRLTNALKSDNKFAGSWGEFVLQSVLDKSALRKGYEYELQVDIKTNEARFRPDALVFLPQEKSIVIDSKVSLKAYEKFVNDNDTTALKEHVLSIKRHVDLLSKKNYHKLVDSIELVLMFIPIESAFVEALKYEKDLFDFAYEKNIIIVSPTTLITVLKTIEYSWKKEFQNKNAKKITQKAAKLYEKFESFLNDMKNIETSLQKAQSSYEQAYKKLSTGNSNLLKLSTELKELENIFEKRKD